MALKTSHIGMTTIQRKSGIVVIKFFGLPMVVYMTSAAIGVIIYCKLSFMHILMTGNAIGRQPFKFLIVIAILHPFKMAGPATLLLMRSQQVVFGFGVIELNIAP